MVKINGGNSAMFMNSFFTDSQAQFNDSQKKFLEFWYEYQKQLSESQKKLFQTWVDSISSGTTQSGFPTATFSGNFETTLNFQQEWLNSALDAQKVAANLAVETQKQFWNNYFQMAKKIVQETPKVS